MASDTLSIAQLRGRAAALRRRADEIDAHIDALITIMDQLVVPEGVLEAVKRSKTAAARTPATPHKGKAPGTMNLNWRDNFARIIEVCGRDPFPIDIVQDVVRELEGRDSKPSALRRQFRTYVDHGYVTQPNKDEYLLTDKLLKMIGSRPTPASPNENEAPSGDAAGASEAGEVAASPNENRQGFRLVG